MLAVRQQTHHMFSRLRTMAADPNNPLLGICSGCSGAFEHFSHHLAVLSFIVRNPGPATKPNRAARPGPDGLFEGGVVIVVV